MMVYPDPAVDEEWQEFTWRIQATWIRTMGGFTLTVKREGQDWWEITVDSPDQEAVFTDSASGKVAAQRRAELYVWHQLRRQEEEDG